ncbi:hypothetical protein Sjap_018494 [Stephania japonica]|uniref:Uncharacterized protein n=1 Tax=Stephania japonica TaxID=461633 RepID=A0AAP0I828_9MAGN
MLLMECQNTANIITMKHEIRMCSQKNEKITPVRNWMHMLTTIVMTKRLKAIMFEMLSAFLLIPIEGIMKAILTHTIIVPVSFVIWSLALGMLVVRSTGSFETIARRVNIAELTEKSLQGKYGLLRRKLKNKSKRISRRHTNVAPAMYKPT